MARKRIVSIAMLIAVLLLLSGAPDLQIALGTMPDTPDSESSSPEEPPEVMAIVLPEGARPYEPENVDPIIPSPTPTPAPIPMPTQTPGDTTAPGDTTVPGDTATPGDTPTSVDTPTPGDTSTPEDTAETETSAPETPSASDVPEISSGMEEAPEPRVNWFWNPPLLWIIIGVLCVLLAVSTLFLVRSRAKRRKPGVTAQADGIQIANIQGMGQRENQQDSFAVTDVLDFGRGVCAVVADGMGGAAYGAEISRIVTSHMVDVFQASAAAAYDPWILLKKMVFSAQKEARDFIGQNGNLTGGSTVVAAIVKDSGLNFASVGDSHVYLLRGGGVVQLIREHVCGAQEEITVAGAQNNPQPGALTSFIGIDGLLRIDFNITPIRLIPGDRVILMSDGVFGVLSDEEIVEAAGMPDIQTAGTMLEQQVTAKANPYQDNYTAIIIGFKGEK